MQGMQGMQGPSLMPSPVSSKLPLAQYAVHTCHAPCTASFAPCTQPLGALTCTHHTCACPQGLMTVHSPHALCRATGIDDCASVGGSVAEGERGSGPGAQDSQRREPTQASSLPLGVCVCVCVCVMHDAGPASMEHRPRQPSLLLVPVVRPQLRKGGEEGTQRLMPFQ